MNREDVKKLYELERRYQEEIFGNYGSNPALNLATFLVFLEDYITRASASYTNKWERIFPEWFISSRESESQGTSPVKAYKYLVTIMALAGAALEAYADIDVSEWRKDVNSSKWVNE